MNLKQDQKISEKNFIWGCCGEGIDQLLKDLWEEGLGYTSRNCSHSHTEEVAVSAISWPVFLLFLCSGTKNHNTAPIDSKPIQILPNSQKLNVSCSDIT